MLLRSPTCELREFVSLSQCHQSSPPGPLSLLSLTPFPISISMSIGCAADNAKITLMDRSRHRGGGAASNVQLSLPRENRNAVRVSAFAPMGKWKEGGGGKSKKETAKMPKFYRGRRKSRLLKKELQCNWRVSARRRCFMQ